jgi:hypothetical protein
MEYNGVNELIVVSELGGPPTTISSSQMDESTASKTSVDPKQKCLFYCLDRVSQSGGQGMVVDELWQYVLSSSDFTEEMRIACGAAENVDSFKHVLSQHPSMFALKVDTESDNKLKIYVSTTMGSTSKSNHSSHAQATIETSQTQTTSSSRDNANEKIRTNSQDSVKAQSGDDVFHSVNEPVNVTTASKEVEEETEIVKRVVVYLLEEKLNEKWIEISTLVKDLQGRHRGDTHFQKIFASVSSVREFLLKHTSVFDVQGELVGLRRRSTNKSSSSKAIPAVVHRPERVNFSTGGTTSSHRGNLRPKSLHIQRSMISEGIKEALLTDSQNIPEPSKANPSYNSASFTYSAPTTPVKSISQTLPSISANEYKAVLCISRLLYSNTSSTPGNPFDIKATHRPDAPFSTSASPFMSISHLNERLCLEADQGVRSTIGYTQLELEEFLHKHEMFFQFRKSQVARKAIEDIHRSIVITGSRPVMESVRTLCNQTGRVCHVSKQWSILDLGNHEHVFFDKSIFKHVTDLRSHFKINEMLYFNAILAPKGSRARWRATHVWKEADRNLVQHHDYLAPRPSATADTPFGHVPVQPFLMNAVEVGNSLKSPTTATVRHRPHPKSGTPSADPCWNSFNGNDPQSGKKAWDTDNWRQHSSSATTTPIITHRSGDEQSNTVSQFSSDKNEIQKSQDNNSAYPRVTSDIKSVKQILQDRAKVHETIPEVSTDNETCPPSKLMSPNNTKQEDNMNPPASSSSPKHVRTMNVIATQTLITGDIMATQFFHEG